MCPHYPESNLNLTWRDGRQELQTTKMMNGNLQSPPPSKYLLETAPALPALYCFLLANGCSEREIKGLWGDFVYCEWSFFPPPSVVLSYQTIMVLLKCTFKTQFVPQRKPENISETLFFSENSFQNSFYDYKWLKSVTHMKWVHSQEIGREQRIHSCRNK